MTEKELKRSNEKWIAGVCGGLAKYFGASPMLIRLLWIVGTIITGLWLGIICYIIFVFVMKKQ